MEKRICKFIMFGLFCLLANDVRAMITKYATNRDTVQNITIFFDRNVRQVDSKYGENNKALASLDSLFAHLANVGCLDSIILSSPFLNDANAKNIRIAQERSEAVKTFLQKKYPLISNARIRQPEGTDFWTALRKLVAADRGVPDQEDVLALMDFHQNNPVKLQDFLRHLDAGIPYRYISSQLLPKMRRTDITICLSSSPQATETEPLPAVAPIPPAEPVSIETEQPAIVPVAVPETENETVVALKNNLLYDLALAPNIEIEIPLGRRWSVNAEYKCPWWSNYSKEFCYQLLSGGVESRYWLGNRRIYHRLAGHFVGIYAEGGIYDFQFKGDGYQGKYYGAAGLTYGYSIRIAPHWGFEFSLGIGYLTTEYQKYAPYEESVVWKSSGRYNFIGPTKAKVSLVWLITKRR